jgi:hypothetical protein
VTDERWRPILGRSLIPDHADRLRAEVDELRAEVVRLTRERDEARVLVRKLDSQGGGSSNDWNIVHDAVASWDAESK